MREYCRSLKGKVIAVLFVAVIPIVIAFIIINSYTMHLVQQEIYEKNHDLLEMQMHQLDYELNSIAEYLKHLDYEDNYTSGFTDEDTQKYYFSANYYRRTISSAIDMYDYVEGMAMLSLENDAVVYVYNEGRSDAYDSRLQVVDYMKANLDWLKTIKNAWKCCDINGTYYLIYVYEQSGVYFCAWANADNLFLNAGNWKITKSNSLFIANADGTVMSSVGGSDMEAVECREDTGHYYFSGSKNQYLMTGVESQNGDFRLFSAVDRNKLLRPYKYLQIVLVCVVILFAAMIPVVLRVLSRNVFRPMGRMMKAIRHVDEGDLEYQIEEKKDNREFKQLIAAFNQMIVQIKDLKIHAYEEELEKRQLMLDKQQIMMEYMQVQIEPHFYLNALNIINTMAQVGDVDLIVQLTENLSEYLRYIAKTKTNSVTIAEEMEHILHYVKIMQIRFGETFQYVEMIDPRALSVKIPPLLIQTIIENTMKYAFDIYGDTHIDVAIAMEERDDFEGVAITVMDNGKGYPDDYILRFNTASSWEGAQIGLWNAKMRLFYMYGENASLTVGNRAEGGACTRIWIPQRSNSLKGPDGSQKSLQRGAKTDEFTDC